MVTNAPDESFTVPRMTPLSVCAKSTVPAKRQKTNLVVLLSIDTSPSLEHADFTIWNSGGQSVSFLLYPVLSLSRHPPVWHWRHSRYPLDSAGHRSCGGPTVAAQPALPGEALAERKGYPI